MTWEKQNAILKGETNLYKKWIDQSLGLPPQEAQADDAETPKNAGKDFESTRRG